MMLTRKKLQKTNRAVIAVLEDLVLNAVGKKKGREISFTLLQN